MQEGVDRRSRSKFTAEEDELVRGAVEALGTGDWGEVAGRVPGRTARQVRDRWRTYLSEGVVCGSWSSEEEERLLSLYGEYGGKWAKIAEGLPGRSDAMVKNRYNMLSRRMGRELAAGERLLRSHPEVLRELARLVQWEGG